MRQGQCKRAPLGSACRPAPSLRRRWSFPYATQGSNPALAEPRQVSGLLLTSLLAPRLGQAYPMSIYIEDTDAFAVTCARAATRTCAPLTCRFP